MDSSGPAASVAAASVIASVAAWVSSIVGAMVSSTGLGAQALKAKTNTTIKTKKLLNFIVLLL